MAIPGINTSDITNAKVTNRDGNYIRIGEHFVTVASCKLFDSSNGKGKVLANSFIVKESAARSYGIVSVSERGQGIKEDSEATPHRSGETVSTVWTQGTDRDAQDRWNSNVKSLLAAVKGTLFNIIENASAAGEDVAEVRKFYTEVGWDLETTSVSGIEVDRFLNATWDGAGALDIQKREQMMDMFRGIPVKCVGTRIRIRDAKKKAADTLVDADIRTISSFFPCSKAELTKKNDALFGAE